MRRRRAMACAAPHRSTGAGREARPQDRGARAAAGGDDAAGCGAHGGQAGACHRAQFSGAHAVATLGARALHGHCMGSARALTRWCSRTMWPGAWPVCTCTHGRTRSHANMRIHASFKLRSQASCGIESGAHTVPRKHAHSRELQVEVTGQLWHRIGRSSAQHSGFLH